VPRDGKPMTLRHHCERILKDLQALYAECPRKSLEKSIRDAKALLTRWPKDDVPVQ
jgi:hypothetical protein